MNIENNYDLKTNSLVISFHEIEEFKKYDSNIIQSICSIFEKNSIEFLKTTISEEFVNYDLHHGLYETHNIFKIRLVYKEDNQKAIDLIEKSLDVRILDNKTLFYS